MPTAAKPYVSLIAIAEAHRLCTLMKRRAEEIERAKDAAVELFKVEQKVRPPHHYLALGVGLDADSVTVISCSNSRPTPVVGLPAAMKTSMIQCKGPLPQCL